MNNYTWIRYTPRDVTRCVLCKEVVFGTGIIRSGTEVKVEAGEANILHEGCYNDVIHAEPGERWTEHA